MLDHLGQHPTCKRCGHRLYGGTCQDCDSKPYRRQSWKPAPQFSFDKPKEDKPKEEPK